MAVIFKTFEEARDYILKGPVGKSLVRLDDGSGYEVKSKSERPIEPPQSLVDNDNEILSVEDLKELIDVKQFVTENINKPRKISKSLFTSTSSTRTNKTKEVKDGYKQAVDVQIENDDLLDINNPCIDCGCEIPQARIDNVPGVVRCAPCQSKFEVANPDSVARKVEEKLGSRDDFKNMRSRQFGVNVRNKS